MNVFQRIGIGLRAWYWAWFVAGAAEHLESSVRSLGQEPRSRPVEPTLVPASPPKPAAQPKPAPVLKASRSEALTLLEALQREARLIDFLKEDISAYQDAQIGAAVRDVHRDSAKLLERLFALRPILDQPEGSEISIDRAETGRFRLVGNVREGATQGSLTHHGWTATKTELPVWSGPESAMRVVAPAEIEVT